MTGAPNFPWWGLQMDCIKWMLFSEYWTSRSEALTCNLQQELSERERRAMCVWKSEFIWVTRCGIWIRQPGQQWELAWGFRNPKCKSWLSTELSRLVLKIPKVGCPKSRGKVEMEIRGRALLRLLKALGFLTFWNLPFNTNIKIYWPLKSNKISVYL